MDAAVTATERNPEKKSHLNALTSLRGIAALWVALYHFHTIASSYGITGFLSHYFIQHGHIGVDIFFILSGFILSHVHLDEFRRIRIPTVFRFLCLRAVRVYPLHWFILLVMAIIIFGARPCCQWFDLHVDLPDPALVTLKEFFASVFLYHQWLPFFHYPWNSPTWTLSLELLAYGCFPLLAYVAGKSPPLLNGLAACVLLFCFGSLFPHLNNVVPSSTLQGYARTFADFTAGVLFYRCRPRSAPYAFAMGVAATIVLIVATKAMIGSGFIWLSAGFIVLGLSNQQSLLSRMLSVSAAQWLGRISYALYLVHVLSYQFVVLYLLPKLATLHPAGQKWLLTAGILCPIAIAALLHYTVELPSRRLGRRWISAHFPNDGEVEITDKGFFEESLANTAK